MSKLLQVLSNDCLSPKAVQDELERGADPNQVSLQKGVSAMHLAAGLGADILAMFIQFGGDPNVRSREGLTPLHVAAAYGDLNALTLLLHHGADASIQDEDGKHPMDLACENGHLVCVKLLATADLCFQTQYFTQQSPRNINDFKDVKEKDLSALQRTHTKNDSISSSKSSNCGEMLAKYERQNQVDSEKKYFCSLITTDPTISSDPKLSRVAEYVLSCTDFESNCSVKNSSDISDSEQAHFPSGSRSKLWESGKESISPVICQAKVESKMGKIHIQKSSSLSSDSSFHTAEEVSDSSNPGHDVNGGSRNATESFGMKDVSSTRWHPPTLTEGNGLGDSDSLMSSENSFICRDERRYFPKISTFKLMSEKSDVEKPNVGSRSKDTVSSVLVNKRKEFGYFSIPRRVDTNDMNDSLFSTITAEEYLYTDPERGITLIEKKIPSECGSSIASRRSLESISSKTSQDSQATLIYDWKTLKTISEPFVIANNKFLTDLNVPLSLSTTQDTKKDSQDLEEIVSSNRGDCDETLEYYHHNDTEETGIPSYLEALSNEQLSQELQKFGEIPGPVIEATRQVYLRRLASLESEPGLVKLSKACPDFPKELRQALNGSFDFTHVSELELEMVDYFSTAHGRQWREGNCKSSFTYLLLDPRVTNNLPLRAKELSDLEVFKTFICAIFYIGKGKRARPYCHLYEAVSKMNNKTDKASAKVQHIVDIWSEGVGVASLHCFQSVIPVEAYTREACMLAAIGIHKVTNIKSGDFYGAVSTWPMHQRRRLGVYLLHKAMTIFLAEGERQICIPDLKPSAH